MKKKTRRRRAKTDDAQDRKKEGERRRSTTCSSAKLISIQEPRTDDNARVDRVYPGQPIAPIIRVRTFSPDEWEDFIQEWASSLKSRYHTVMRCSSAGDMGRDVVAHTGRVSSGKPWDNYQCKHYDHPLRPSEIWIELGKLVHYTYQGEFTVPREYFFVSPHDVGTTLARLLERPRKLREGLLKNWEKYCQSEIGSEDIKLTGKFKTYVEEFPYDIVTLMPVLKVIEEHRQTPWHVHTFGGGLPDRPPADEPPEEFAPCEIPYLSELFRAYTDYKAVEVTDDTLSQWPRLEKHLLLSRASFYSAESLKEFSRDHLPENEYVRLKDEVHDGVQEAYLDSHDDGYQKVLSVTKAAIDLQVTDHALLPVLQPPDRRGICHQLVNDGQFIWVERNGEDD